MIECIEDCDYNYIRGLIWVIAKYKKEQYCEMVAEKGSMDMDFAFLKVCMIELYLM